MSDVRSILERGVGGVTAPRDPFERMLRLGERKRRRQRIAAGAVGVAVALAIAVGLGGSLLRSERDIGDRERIRTNGPLTTFGEAGLRRLVIGDNRSTGEAQLCDGCTYVRDAAWTLDGTRLAYSAGCFGACGENPDAGIWVLDSRSGSQRVLLREAELLRDVPIIALDWSPDARRIVFAVEHGGIFVIDVETSAVASLRTPPSGAASIAAGDATSVSWSPDGARVAYSGSVDGRSWLFSVGVDGRGGRALGLGAHPEWSPTGARIAFRIGCELWTMAADGSDRTLLHTFPKSTWGHINRETCGPQLDIIRALGPIWSPDGRELAAVFADRLYVISADGSDVRIVQDPIERSLGGVGMGVEWRPAA